MTAMSLNAYSNVLFVPRVPSPLCSKGTKSTVFLTYVREEQSGLSIFGQQTNDSSVADSDCNVIERGVRLLKLAKLYVSAQESLFKHRSLEFHP